MSGIFVGKNEKIKITILCMLVKHIILSFAILHRYNRSNFVTMGLLRLEQAGRVEQA